MPNIECGDMFGDVCVLGLIHTICPITTAGSWSLEMSCVWLVYVTSKYICFAVLIYLLVAENEQESLESKLRCTSTTREAGRKSVHLYYTQSVASPTCPLPDVWPLRSTVHSVTWRDVTLATLGATVIFIRQCSVKVYRSESRVTEFILGGRCLIA